MPCGPEIVIERLDRPELWRTGPLVRARRLQALLSRRLGGHRATRSPPGTIEAAPAEARMLVPRMLVQ